MTFAENSVSCSGFNYKYSDTIVFFTYAKTHSMAYKFRSSQIYSHTQLRQILHFSGFIIISYFRYLQIFKC